VTIAAIALAVVAGGTAAVLWIRRKLAPLKRSGDLD